jgi:hypothetical protein
MDYTDCNDFLWPIEIFGFNKIIPAQNFLCSLYNKYFTFNTNCEDQVNKEVGFF